MSYIRYTADGEYVDIPEGSNYYIYGNGNNISGWTDGEFAALIGQVADELAIEQREATAIKAGFRSHFEGWEPTYGGGITPPERGEIFCHCVDSRIGSLKLTDELHEAVQDWVAAFEAYRECDYCSTEFRPSLYNEETPYICDNEQCSLEADAERFGITVTELETATAFDSFDDEWDYIVEHSGKDLE